VQEERLLHHKLYAALAYCRQRARPHGDRQFAGALGIITSGKSYLDVRQALDDLGIDEATAAAIGLRLYKVGMVWPLDAEGVRRFADGLDEILVDRGEAPVPRVPVEGRALQLEGRGAPARDRQVRREGRVGATARTVAAAGGGRAHPGDDRARDRRPHRALPHLGPHQGAARLHRGQGGRARQAAAVHPAHAALLLRLPAQHLDQGAAGLARDRRHRLPLHGAWLSPEHTQTFTQMGGEGVPWIGQAPFTDTPHVFANLGDGTYMHSGILAIRAAVAAKVNITYKILYNDAVAMTGGQPHDGTLSVPIIARQLLAEGVGTVVVVNDEPDARLWPGRPAARRRHPPPRRARCGAARAAHGAGGLRDHLRPDLRRREAPPPQARHLPRPGQARGDQRPGVRGLRRLQRQVELHVGGPVETEFGRKRFIDQSSCNKDYSCVKGFCPSFVTVEGGTLKKGKASGASALGRLAAELPEPQLPDTAAPWGILITGVGGTGVVTIGALLGMAAHLEGKGISVLDMAGLAQKGGAVWSHVRIADRQEQLHAARVAAGEANAVIGCDLVVAASDESLAKMQHGLTRVVINRDQTNTSEFVRGFAAQARSGDVLANPDPQFPAAAMEAQIVDAVGAGNAEFLDARRIATDLLGDSIATNLFMLGFAWQRALVPLSRQAIERAIEINGTAIEANKAAFLWGRRAAADLRAVREAAKPQFGTPPHHRLSTGVDEVIARRKAQLADYQDTAYAGRYVRLVERVRGAEAKVAPGITLLTEAVARGYHKLLAYKDEYEVARLYTDSDFLQRVEEQFEGDYKLVFHLAPPMLADKDPHTGELKKKEYGPWMLKAMRVLAKFRHLRGTRLDPFARSHDRKLDRELITDYERLVDEIVVNLERSNHEAAIELAALPEQIRGYGHVRERYLAGARKQQAALLEDFRHRRAPSTPLATKARKTIAIIPG
jgi:indolepyruvate ferredoxin oxidoreductase